MHILLDDFSYPLNQHSDQHIPRKPPPASWQSLCAPPTEGAHSAGRAGLVFSSNFFMPASLTYEVIPQQGSSGLGTRPAQPTRTEKNLCYRPGADRHDPLAQTGLSCWNSRLDGILSMRSLFKGLRLRKEKRLSGAPLLPEISLCFWTQVSYSPRT